MSNDVFYKAIDLAQTHDNKNNDQLFDLLRELYDISGYSGFGSLFAYLVQKNRFLVTDHMIENYSEILTKPLVRREFRCDFNQPFGKYFAYQSTFASEMATYADIRILNRYTKRNLITFEDNSDEKVFPLLFSLYAKRNIQQLNKVIQHGGNLNYKDDYGNSLIHYSLRSHNIASLTVLLDNGLSVNAQNDMGNTVLHELFMYDIKLKQAIPFYKEISKYDPDLSIKNNEGVSVLDRMEWYYSILENTPRHKNISSYFHGQHILHEKQKLTESINIATSDNKNISRI